MNWENFHIRSFLKKLKGISIAKAITITTALELGRESEVAIYYNRQSNKAVKEILSLSHKVFLKDNSSQEVLSTYFKPRANKTEKL
jgi:hypothetical protein